MGLSLGEVQQLMGPGLDSQPLEVEANYIAKARAASFTARQDYQHRKSTGFCVHSLTWHSMIAHSHQENAR